MVETKITLKDGRTVNLVSLTPEDIDRLLALLSRMPKEASRWSMAPYRREWVERWLNTPTLIHLAAEHAGELVGFACIEAYAHTKRRGVGYLGFYSKDPSMMGFCRDLFDSYWEKGEPLTRERGMRVLERRKKFYQERKTNE